MKKRQILFQFFLLIGICVAVLAINIIFGTLNRSSEYHEEITLDENWDISVNEETFENVNLNEKRFNLFNRDDKFTLKTILPEKLPAHPVLKLYQIHSAFNVYVDGCLIYEYGHDIYEKGHLLGYGYHFISLKDSDAGKELFIDMVITENEAFSSQEAPIIADSNYVHRDFVIQNRVKIAIIMFLMIFGIIVFVGAVIFAFKDRSLISLAGAGMFSFTIGGWSCCTTDVIECFTYSLQVKSFLEYGCLYLAAAFIMIYFAYEIKDEGKKRWICFQILMCLQITFSVGAWILQIFNIVRFPGMLKICHVLFVALVLFLLVRFIKDTLRGKVHGSLLVIGFEILAIFVCYDLLRFNFKKYITSSDDHYVSLAYIGVLIFVLTLLADFIIKYLKDIHAKIEKETLEKLAYSDYMTGLANRRALEEFMDKLEKEGTPYAVVSFDLNDLKKVNDSLGHEEGDRYIRSFADALKSVYDKSGMVARMGGDEFTVVLYKDNIYKTAELYSALEEGMNRLNSENASWNMTTACGACRFDESGIRSIRQAFKIADERMYVRKGEMKNGAIN